MRLVLRVEDQLQQAAAVAQVDEDQAAVVAAAVNPAGNSQLLADVVLAHIAGPDRAVTVRARLMSHAGSSSASSTTIAASTSLTSCSDPAVRTRIDSGPTIATASARKRPACLSCPFNERPACSI